jgi:hypothetical protein
MYSIAYLNHSFICKCKKFYRIGPLTLKPVIQVSNLNVTTVSITTFRIMTLSIEGLFITLNINSLFRVPFC